MTLEIANSVAEFVDFIVSVILGGRFGEVNQAGIEFYNKLIDALLLKGNYCLVSDQSQAAVTKLTIALDKNGRVENYSH